MTPPTNGPQGSARNATPSPRQRVLGDFLIESELGRGGMGVVWLAVQRSLGRKVALKALPGFATMDADAVLRFRREAEATARLAHPNIVPVYGTGEADGIHWFAMEFIDGPTLGVVLEALAMRQVEKLRASLVEEAMLAERYPAMREPTGPGHGNAYVRSCARLCADLANALVAAHRAGVVHRDLKPNNVLIHPAGRPVLVDFGLARDEQQQGLTRTGEQIGTPAYMAPEQARGHRDVDARVDVYGLGAVLYELLTLRPPFEGATAAETAHRILTEEPIAVRSRNPNVPVDLAAIVHRCLAKDPTQRYPAMEALEHDLRSFLTGRPVAAALPGRMAQLQSMLQRKWRSISIGATAAAVATTVAILAGVADDRADVRRGEDLLRRATELLVERGNPVEARALYEQAAALTKDPGHVSQVRLRDFRAAFARRYQDKPRGPLALRAFAEGLSAAERSDVQDLLDRLDGRGSLRLGSRVLEQATKQLEVRAVDGERLAPDWRVVHVGEALPTGAYLVRATDQHGAVSMATAQVDADAATVLVPRFVQPGELPAGAVSVTDPADGQVLGVAATEVTRGDWQRWVAAQKDPGLAAELTPQAVLSPGEVGEDLPVRGITFLQARAFARAAGAHLPTAREQWLAGSGGLPSLVMPWGGAPEQARIAADPFHMDEAVSVRARPEGCSPLGVFHVLGNVAEMQSAAHDGIARLGGGSFLDDPAGLRLFGDRATVPVATLSGLGHAHPGAGLRLFWFVPPVAPDDKAIAAERVERERRREELRAANDVCRFSDWTLLRDGTMQCSVEWNGTFRAGDPRQLQLPFDTPGFLQRLDRVRVLDGHGQELPRTALVAAGGERSRLETALGELRDGQGYRFSIAAELDPDDGLLPARDGYVLRLPMKRPTREAQLHTLTLPEGCRVDDVQPTPTAWSQDRRTLTFEQGAGQIETAVVRFRCDGAIGPAVVPHAPAAERTERFLRQWNLRIDDLGDQLDRDFLFSPGQLDRKTVTRRQPMAWFTPQPGESPVVDVVRIGAVETVELRVDWEMRDRSNRPFVLPRWPLLVQWRDGKNGPRVVRVQPVTAVDSGRYDGRGGYVHDGLRIRVDAVPDAPLSRTQEELVDLQVRLAHTSGLSAQITACLADAAEPLAATRFRLANGATILRTGERTDGGAEDANVQDWAFGSGPGSVRERWTFLQRGRRHVLVRFIAAGAVDGAAAPSLTSPVAVEFCESVRKALHLD